MKNFQKAITFIAAFMALAIYALIVYNAFIKYNVTTFTEIMINIAIAVSGIIVGYALHNILHEVGHILGAILSGGVVTEAAVLGINFTKTKKKLKTRFVFLSLYAGWTTFVAKKNPDKSKKILINSLIGGLIGSLMVLISSVVIVLLSPNIEAVLGFGAGFAISFYMIVVNFLSLNPQSDGALLMTRGINFSDAVKRLTVESYAYLGKSLKEMPKELFDNPVYSNGYYSALRYLEKGEVSSCEALVQKLDKNADNEAIALHLLSLFIAIIKKDELKVSKDAEMLIDIDDNSPAVLRTLIAYADYKGEKEWKEALLKGFEKEKEIFLYDGLYKTEREILRHFVLTEK